VTPLPSFRRVSISEEAAVAGGVLIVSAEFPQDAVIPTAPAKTTSPIRIRKILCRTFFFRGIWFLAGIVKLLTPRSGAYS
jgi:hypothetical protein